MDEAKEQTAVTVGEAYVSGALTALDDAPRTKVFYELLAEIAEAANLRAYLPHRVTDPIAQAHLDPRAVYEIDRAHITGASVLIAYAGIPSFGVGIEVELARERGVPVVVVAERDRPISRLLLGNPAVVNRPDLYTKGCGLVCCLKFNWPIEDGLVNCPQLIQVSGLAAE